MSSANPTLALLAGGGKLPGVLALAAANRGWGVHAVTFAGQPQPADLATLTHKEFPMGQIGHILAHLKATKTTHVAMAGNLSKPGILSLKPDAMGLKLLARAVIKHDDALLRVVTSFLEEQGFTLVSVQDLVPDLLAPAGLLTKNKPSAEDIEDIALARSVLSVVGDLDIGQAVVVHNGAILGVEAAEGTDALITRCAELRGDLEKGTRGGLLVKRAKPTQTDVADLPFVGPTTLQLLSQHHYRGLAVQAGKTLLLNRPELIAIANTHSLFIQSDA
jgi:hypothetical protein